MRTGSESSLDVLVQKLQGWLETDRLYQVAHYNHMQRALAELGLASFRPLLNDWSPTSADLTLCLRAAYYGGLVNQAYSATPEIQQFNRLSQEHLLKEFRTLDKSVFNFAKESLVTQLYERLPNFNAPGKWTYCDGNSPKAPPHSHPTPSGRSHHRHTAGLPVFMMSPMSVATYLPPGLIEFDLVIFDEASQIKRRMPWAPWPAANRLSSWGQQTNAPTNFFGRAVELSDEEAEESATADVESILDMMLAKGAPEKMLRWHYRSRHHSLIAVSNHQFYDSKLFVSQPGGQSDSMGLKHHLLADTTYDRGVRAPIRARRSRSPLRCWNMPGPGHTCLWGGRLQHCSAGCHYVCVGAASRGPAGCRTVLSSRSRARNFFIKIWRTSRATKGCHLHQHRLWQNRVRPCDPKFRPDQPNRGERRLNVLISRARKGWRCSVISPLKTFHH